MKNIALTETNNLNTLLISENVKLVVQRHHQEPTALPLQPLHGELGSLILKLILGKQEW